MYRDYDYALSIYFAFKSQLQRNVFVVAVFEGGGG
jgi:hypothetical protein